MTPDMRRLALAVAKVRWHDPAPSDEEWTDEALANFECEAIVRAVLTELASPSEAMEQVAMRYTAEVDDKVVGIGEAVCDGFTAMIDHILDTKARRDAALSDLAEIDRDLL